MKIFTFKQGLFVLLVLIAGCKKDGDGSVNSFVLQEQFVSVRQLQFNDWKFVNNNAPNITASWAQGYTPGKIDLFVFAAKSYTTSQDEYAFVNGYYPYATATAEISSWMITRALTLKNGDIVRFYTRASNRTGSINRLQLLLNETSDSYDVGNTPASVGLFTKVLLDINANQTADGFPASDWTLQSATIAGLSGAIRTRLAFRYVASGLTASGIGVDELSITRN